MTDVEKVIEDLESIKRLGAEGSPAHIKINNAIQTIRELCDKSDELEEENFRLGNTVDELNEHLTDAFEKIRELQAQIPKWHLCEEELPTNYEHVLVDYEYFRYGNYNCMFRTVGIAYYIHEYDMWHVEGGGHQIKIHAWTELPKLEGE